MIAFTRSLLNIQRCMKIQLLFALFPLLSCVAYAAGGFSDSTSGFAKQKIVQKLQITKISDLNFGEASPGDGAKVIPAGVSENNENASFEVRGEPFRLFQIVLPSDNSVKMINGSGGTHKEILIKSFESYPAKAGILTDMGRSTIFIGASREAISSRQVVGDYIGQFYITVVY